MACEFIQRLPGVFSTNGLYHLDFLKLVLTNHAPGISPIGTCLTTETGCMRDVPDWQHICLNNLISHLFSHLDGSEHHAVCIFSFRLHFTDDFITQDIGQRNLCRWYQVVIMLGVQLEQIFFKLG